MRLLNDEVDDLTLDELINDHGASLVFMGDAFSLRIGGTELFRRELDECDLTLNDLE